MAGKPNSPGSGSCQQLGVSLLTEGFYCPCLMRELGLSGCVVLVAPLPGPPLALVVSCERSLGSSRSSQALGSPASGLVSQKGIKYIYIHTHTHIFKFLSSGTLYLTGNEVLAM